MRFHGAKRTRLQTFVITNKHRVGCRICITDMPYFSAVESAISGCIRVVPSIRSHGCVRCPRARRGAV
jgi:hypothetical protein